MSILSRVSYFTPEFSNQEMLIHLSVKVPSPNAVGQSINSTGAVVFEFSITGVADATAHARECTATITDQNHYLSCSVSLQSTNSLIVVVVRPPLGL